ncbi:MAG TPA: hypothetical protein VNU68_34620 [Verrucomicrobiae bacterium]|nr:hypothetical protein [Verrucomicrobiae bacterium]
MSSPESRDTTPVDSLNPIRSNKLRPTKIFDDDREVRWGDEFHPGGEFAGGGVGDAEAARIAGVHGVPFFVTNGQPAFSGVQSQTPSNSLFRFGRFQPSFVSLTRDYGGQPSLACQP